MITFEHFKLEEGTPIYQQILLYIKRGIIAGSIGSGDELPSRRMMSALLGINPNTVQKALDTLEEQGLLYSVRGSGWYIREDITRAREVLHDLRMEKTKEFFAVMESLGLSAEETRAFVKEWYCE